MVHGQVGVRQRSVRRSVLAAHPDRPAARRAHRRRGGVGQHQHCGGRPAGAPVPRRGAAEGALGRNRVRHCRRRDDRLRRVQFRQRAGVARVPVGGAGRFVAGLPVHLRTQDVPAPFLSVAGAFSLSLMTMLAVGTGLVQDASLTQASERPGEAALWLALLGAVILINTASNSTGGQLCPAAVSATLIMGAGMVSGYAVQAVVFGAEGSPPRSPPILGAALMMASMLFMASSRAQPAADAPRPAVLGVVPGLQPDEPEDAATEGEPDDGAESFRSFASFASAEFAAASPTAAVQLQRRKARAAAPPARPACAPVARTLGAAVVAATCART
ncbi:unnamed protein product [Prorocentrum cordatum]|uniref:Phosphate transporter n=1 Tax=Prorocentrum cordatum TaxID=2364126 RepID=A0ABN9TKV7_9DINO|nr:unnamed protein product [Polarella glacialis]